ncbi:MAG: hypothetical protein ACJAT2_001155 [Bacteriovoracaceae bacterium]|jgi:hypothetical protein
MKSIIVLGAMLLSTASFAWGPTGHRIVGQIAENHLKLLTKRRVKKLLDGESLARVSNWPDKIKSDPDNFGHTYSWHYTDWADTTIEYNRTDNSGSLVASIESNLSTLKNEKATKAERAFALKFLVHLVGDIHQPLHVGNGLDRGGNRCRVVYQGEETNLHNLWDEKLIEFTRLSFTEYSKFIDIKSKKENRDLNDGSPLSWAKESADLRPSLYPEEVNQVVAKNGATLRNYCNKDLNLPVDQLPKLGYTYGYKLIPLMEKRMLQAGLRLAKLINDAL